MFSAAVVIGALRVNMSHRLFFICHLSAWLQNSDLQFSPWWLIWPDTHIFIHLHQMRTDQFSLSALVCGPFFSVPVCGPFFLVQFIPSQFYVTSSINLHVTSFFGFVGFPLIYFKHIYKEIILYWSVRSLNTSWSELQIRGGIEDNSKTIFLISQ